jgi:hypothetical protein
MLWETIAAQLSRPKKLSYNDQLSKSNGKPNPHTNGFERPTTRCEATNGAASMRLTSAGGSGTATHRRGWITIHDFSGASAPPPQERAAPCFHPLSGERASASRVEGPRARSQPRTAGNHMTASRSTRGTDSTRHEEAPRERKLTAFGRSVSGRTPSPPDSDLRRTVVGCSKDAPVT